VHIRQSRFDRIVRQQEKQEHCVICGWVQYQHGLSGKMREREKQKRGRLLKFRTMCTSFICAHFWMKDEYTQRSGLQCPNFVVIHTADHAAIVRYTTEISAKRHSQPCRQPSASAMRTNKAHISCTVSGSWVGGWEGVGEEGAREGK